MTNFLIFQCHDIFQENHEEVFRDNNRRKPRDLIDLHGLFVDEAKEVFLRRLETAQKDSENSLKFITGKGIHSPGGVPKIRQAIEDLCDDLNLTHHRHPNDGIVVVNLIDSFMAPHLSPKLQSLEEIPRMEKHEKLQSLIEAAQSVEKQNETVPTESYKKESSFFLVRFVVYLYQLIVTYTRKGKREETTGWFFELSNYVSKLFGWLMLKR